MSATSHTSRHTSGGTGPAPDQNLDQSPGQPAEREAGASKSGALKVTAPPPNQPRLSDKGRARAKTREERMAEALRENLRRRKEQQRARDDGKA